MKYNQKAIYTEENFICETFLDDRCIILDEIKKLPKDELEKEIQKLEFEIKHKKTNDNV